VAFKRWITRGARSSKPAASVNVWLSTAWRGGVAVKADVYENHGTEKRIGGRAGMKCSSAMGKRQTPGAWFISRNVGSGSAQHRITRWQLAV